MPSSPNISSNFGDMQTTGQPLLINFCILSTAHVALAASVTRVSRSEGVRVDVRGKEDVMRGDELCAKALPRVSKFDLPGAVARLFRLARLTAKCTR